MPRIPKEFLDCVVYLYNSRSDAEKGEGPGGTGFFVGMDSPNFQWTYAYAVTAAHNIKNGASVVRINRLDGRNDIFEFCPEDWVRHPFEDIPIVEMSPSEPHEYTLVWQGSFVTKSVIDAHDIGPGDDIFMGGRFVLHDGRQRNQPSVRFGSISMMPGEPVIHGTFETAHECFVVAETRSHPGYSGSPVFLYISPFAMAGKNRDKWQIWLLGVDWGHIPTHLELVLPSGGKSTAKARINAGMITIAPAWCIQELMDLPILAEKRERNEQALVEIHEDEASTK